MTGHLTHSEEELRAWAAFAVERAGLLGAEASVTTRTTYSGRVFVANGAVETAERDLQQSLGISVYCEGRSAGASTAALNRESVVRVVEEALLIARQVQPDADSELPPADWLALSGPAPALYAEGGADTDELLAAALAIDCAARERAAADPALRISESAAIGSEGIWALATSRGFCRSSHFSSHHRWCKMMASTENGSVSDFEQTQDRRFSALAGPDILAARAAERTLAARGARGVASRRCPVLFDPSVASQLVGELVVALNGMAQYRRSTFLPDPLDRAIAADHIDLYEDPFEPFGLASGGFDSDGIAGSARLLIEGGIGRGLLLSAMAARKLGLRSTGNAEGPYNLRLSSRTAGGDRAAMLTRLGTGVLVTSLQGGGTDPVTGNWTRAISGLWVEDGEVAHALRDVTLAGSLGEMMMGMVAVGDDVERHGAVRTGSILVGEMQLGGKA